jgi:pimeloyl-ACP methyl ester carboxylesterase
MARSDSLGQPRTVRLPHGVIGYRELGQGPAVVFVHGLLVNADLWRNVVPVVAAAGYRCSPRIGPWVRTSIRPARAPI